MREVAICAARRTAIGGLQGALSALTAADLGGAAIRAARGDAGGTGVEACVMGCVLPAGQGQAPARQAGFAGGLGAEVPAITVNKMCGSGLQAVAMAADSIALGQIGAAVAGGTESMSRAPYLLPRMRQGARLGHAQALDHMFLDGLEDAYEPGRLMGTYAEDCAGAYQFTRAAQDAYALASLDRALAAQAAGWFTAEIAPVTVPARDGSSLQASDEQPQTARPDKIPHLRPAFREGGTVTAANSSSISDGAAALLLASRDEAGRRDLPVRALLRGHAGHAQAPGLFTTAPVPAARKLLDRLEWSVADVDLWEVNEAFAVVPMAFMHEMGVPHERLNVNGGACALGHPIGASGARILVTLLHAMEARDLRRGVAAICIGGGEGLAMAIERV